MGLYPKTIFSPARSSVLLRNGHLPFHGILSFFCFFISADIWKVIRGESLGDSIGCIHVSSLVSNQILTMLTFLSKKNKKGSPHSPLDAYCALMVDCMSTSPHAWTVFSHAGCVSCPTLSRMQPLCLWQHVDEELMCKLEMDQSSRFRNRDANVAVSFPFLSSMRAENVSQMVRLVGGRLPNGAIAPLS